MVIAVLAALLSSCSSDDSIIDDPQQPVNEQPQVFTMTIEANKGGDNADSRSTRALSLGGENNKTLNATWAEGEIVKVYQSGSEIGELTAAASETSSTTLTGTFASAPSTEAPLTFYFHTADDPNYSGQNGTLEEIATTYDFCAPATVTTGNFTVNETTKKITIPDGISFGANQQAIIKFTLLDKANDAAISPSALTVTDGTCTVSLTSIPNDTYTANEATNVLYVAFPAAGTAKTITLTATVGSDEYTYEKSEVTFTNGQYYSITVKMVKTMVPPTLTTGAVTFAGTGPSPNAATGKVTLTDAGNYGEANEIGLCWGTAENPTIADSHAAAAGHTVGTEYTVDMGTLEQGTTYYIRGYAKVGDSYFYGNEVSVKTYHLISSSTDWNNFAAVVNNGTDATAKAVQMANISGVTTVVGNSESTPFRGTYNGQGYTISNVNINNSEGEGANPTGLFGTVKSASAVIENVVVASGRVSSTGRNVGSVVGELNSGIVRYCANYAEVTSSYNGQARLGGVVGWMRSKNSGYGGANNHVSYCINYGYVHGESYVGGIVGTFGAGTLTYCQNYGHIQGTGASTGGIAGWQYSSGYVPAYNHNGGNITTSSSNTGDNTNRYIISNSNFNSNYSSNSYLTSLTATIKGTAYTGTGLEQFVPDSIGPAALTSNPAGITIGGTTYSWDTPAP